MAANAKAIFSATQPQRINKAKIHLHILHLLAKELSNDFMATLTSGSTRQN